MGLIDQTNTVTHDHGRGKQPQQPQGFLFIFRTKTINKNVPYTWEQNQVQEIISYNCCCYWNEVCLSMPPVSSTSCENIIILSVNSHGWYTVACSTSFFKILELAQNSLKITSHSRITSNLLNLWWENNASLGHSSYFALVNECI